MLENVKALSLSCVFFKFIHAFDIVLRHSIAMEIELNPRHVASIAPSQALHHFFHVLFRVTKVMRLVQRGTDG